MDNKKLVKTYFWLLFCDIVISVLLAYAYIKHDSPYLLMGFTLSFGSAIEMFSLIRAVYKESKRRG